MLSDFFDSITLDIIQAFVTDAQEEHLSLEFKTVSGPELKSGNDKRNLAEALSGFANSAGGVVVWGVGTRKGSSGEDVAAAAQPIPNVELFANRLLEFTPLYVTPTVPGVVHRSFVLPDQSGYVATYVPESDTGPHMALAGVDRYFKRGPAGFYRLHHFDIADMFGRRQKPVISLQLGEPLLVSSWNERQQVRINVLLVNEGRASAIAPFVRLNVKMPFQVNPAGFSSRDEGALLRLVTEASQPPTYALLGSTDFIVHPKVSFQIAELTAEIRETQDVPECRIEWSAAAMDAVLVESSTIIAPIRIAAALGRTVASDSGSY